MNGDQILVACSKKRGLLYEHDTTTPICQGFLGQAPIFVCFTASQQDAILFGVETHVCVQQTALDLMDRGIQAPVNNPSR